MDRHLVCKQRQPNCLGVRVWHKQWASVWHANEDSQACRHGVRDGWVHGLHMRMAGHGGVA